MIQLITNLAAALIVVLALSVTILTVSRNSSDQCQTTASDSSELQQMLDSELSD